MSERINSFRELNVYQQACELDYRIHLESKKFPRDETYSLTDQIRRSSRSVGANLAEAWAKRRYPAHFASKLTDADGELQETRHWLDRAFAYGYVSAKIKAEIDSVCDRVGQKLGAMMRNPDGWRRQPAEPAARTADGGGRTAEVRRRTADV